MLAMAATLLAADLFAHGTGLSRIASTDSWTTTLLSRSLGRPRANGTRVSLRTTLCCPVSDPTRRSERGTRALATTLFAAKYGVRLWSSIRDRVWSRSIQGLRRFSPGDLKERAPIVRADRGRIHGRRHLARRLLGPGSLRDRGRRTCRIPATRAVPRFGAAHPARLRHRRSGRQRQSTHSLALSGVRPSERGVDRGGRDRPKRAAG